MTAPLSRRGFGGAVAVGALAAATPDDPEEQTDERPPLLAPKPPVPRGLGTQAGLLYEVLISQFPESRVAAKRNEIARQIARNLYYGQVLATAGLSHFDGPGPLWTAYREEAFDGQTPDQKNRDGSEGVLNEAVQP
ncbi:MAG: hypothetical protein AAF907_00710 [Planctomycetota bacterium]